MSTTVVYEKETGRVVIMNSGSMWALPSSLDVKTFNDDEEVFLDDGAGDVYLKAAAYRERVM